MVLLSTGIRFHGDWSCVGAWICAAAGGQPACGKAGRGKAKKAARERKSKVRSWNGANHRLPATFRISLFRSFGVSARQRALYTEVRQGLTSFSQRPAPRRVSLRGP
ncbi:hypothetical protein VUR80DRAFT_5537 [Thermomyces stellatus]